MAGLQGFTTGTSALLDLDPYRFPAVFIDGCLGETQADHGFVESGDYLLAAPESSSRLSRSLEPADRRRLELHAALTTAGIAPLPGDLHAIEALCALDDTTHVALQRWINRTP